MATDTRPRVPIAASYVGPGPGYSLPTLVGRDGHDPQSVYSKSPAWSMGMKRTYSEPTGPGPCYYVDPKMTSQGRDTLPSYSIRSRPKERTTNFITPGPGSYELNPVLAKPPSGFSIGSRKFYKRDDNVPAPNSYLLPSVIGQKTAESKLRQAPVALIRSRSAFGSIYVDLQQTPGPATYGAINPDLYRRRCPSATLKSRQPLPADKTMKPGPGTYTLDKVYPDKQRAPSFTLGRRHSQYIVPFMHNVYDY